MGRLRPHLNTTSPVARLGGAQNGQISALFEALIGFLDSFARAWNVHDVETIVPMMTLNAIFLMSGSPSPTNDR